MSFSNKKTSKSSLKTLEAALWLADSWDRRLSAIEARLDQREAIDKANEALANLSREMTNGSQVQEPLAVMLGKVEPISPDDCPIECGSKVAC